MATRFEIVLHGANPVSLRAAGEEALDEVDRIEALLSLYRPTSEIANVNARAAREPVRVSPEVFRLLERARELSAATGGAFDITIAPLVRCWGFMGGTGRMPEASEIEAVRAQIGMHLVELNPRDFTVRFVREGVMLDLGAIGKGYAIEQAVEFLHDAGVTSALLHGGTSTIHALGRPPGDAPWKIALERPPKSAEDKPELLALVPLENEAMSVSAVWGRHFQNGGKNYGHVIDPRTGFPTESAQMTAVVLESATETDALSTALLTQGVDGIELLHQLRPSARSLVIARGSSGQNISARGIEVIS